jgi:hypothetical protein
MQTWYQNHCRSFALAVLLTAVLSCNQNPPKPIAATKYVAYLNADTAFATMEISKALFKGVLEIRYKSGYKDSGNVKGFVKGDTLMGEYHYQKYWFPVWKRDPIIFLKKGSKLIMGKGIVKYTMGIPHYNNLYPVDYTQSKHFVFIPKK